MDRPIHVVGGGIAGLVAAITAAEAGAPVVVHEAAERVGGRALGGTDRPGVNLGPHVVFTDGALVKWLRAREIEVRLRRPSPRGGRVLDDRGLHFPLGEAMQLAVALPRRQAPVDESFGEWAHGVFGSSRAAAMCRLAGLFTYHHDPGSLSARFVWDRYRRTLLSPDRVRWVVGGWATLVDALSARATACGVRIEVGDHVTPGALPDAPTIVATRLANASRLLETPLRWPGARTALLDVLATRRAGWPNVVADMRTDLTTCCMIERELAIDAEMLGGADLFQAQLGIAPETGVDAGVGRIEDAFDRAVGGWREHTVWRRGHVVADATGAVDPPGATWRDRPRIDQGHDRFLAGDAVASPGLLSEVAVNSGVHAARLALDARRRLAFSVGWPTADLSPERRFAVLGAALPGASVRQVQATVGADETWDIEPVDETGPGYQLTTRAGVLRGAAVQSSPTGGRITALAWSRWPRPLARVLARAHARSLVATMGPSSGWRRLLPSGRR
ncbi:MAG: FAD-dependent oxidoreductase [Acidimicrobiales bacterium]